MSLGDFLDKAKMGYITFPNAEEAQKLCMAMVKQKLIACANILPPHTAIYQWNNSLKSETECAAIVKTWPDKVSSVMSFITKNHSYSNPCVVFWSLEEGPDNFNKWIYTQTHD